MDRLKYEGSQHQRRGCVQWRIQGRCPGGPPPLFLDQTEARRAEKVSFVLRPGSSPPRLSQGLDDRASPPTLPEGLNFQR